MRRIVLVRAGALGDFLLGLPALVALRRTYPGAELIVAGPMPQVTLALGDGSGPATQVFDVGEPALARLFDPRATLLHAVPGALREADLALVWLRRPDEVVKSLERLGARRVVAQSPVPALPGVHAADWLLDEVRRLERWSSNDLVGGLDERRTTKSVQGATAGLEGNRWDATPWLRPPAGAPAWVAAWLAASVPRRPLVVVHPGSGSPRKNWPGWPALVARLACEHHVGVVLTAGPADSDALAQVLQALDDRRTAAGRPAILDHPDLARLAALLQSADLYLGNDSGVTHLAAAAGAPVVAVFGPTDPRTWRPRGPRVTVLGGIPCGPEVDTSLPARWPDPEEVYEAATARLAVQADS